MSIGPSPWYKPRRPSSRIIIFPVPIIPRYKAFVSPDCAARRANPPCACSLVLMTSRGQVTIPEATPAKAPQTGAIHMSGTLVENFSRRVTNSDLGDASPAGTWGMDEAVCSFWLLTAVVLSPPSERIVMGRRSRLSVRLDHRELPDPSISGARSVLQYPVQREKTTAGNP